MLSHVSLQVADPDHSARFYLAVFAPLGIREAMRFPRGEQPVIGLSGPDGMPELWLGPVAGAPGTAREVHLALSAPDQQAVDDVHTAALETGAEILHAPREWPEYFPGYYAVFLRDPDGNNVEAVTALAPPVSS